MQRALRTLTLLQHVLFSVLAIVCAGRSVSVGAEPVPEVTLILAILAWYAVGAPASLSHPDVEPVRLRQRGTGGPWLLGLTALWLALAVVSHENVWLAFSLWLLAGHLLPRGWAVTYAALLLGVVIVLPWWATQELSTPGVIGPTIGAVFALVVSRGQVQLVREAMERQRLVLSLVAAQEEAETLHAELARTQRDSGALAERTRLSRDIHDTLAQGLSSIVLLARTGQITPSETQLRNLLRQIEHTAADNLDEARRVVSALAPRDLEAAGLPAALRRILDGLAAETGIDTELRLEGDLTGLPTTAEVALLRTAQGALANVRRHAQASRVVVSLSELGDSVRLDVVDDGVGFDPAAAVADGRPIATGGYGLPSTRARLRELGGGLEIESTPGEGAALSAHLPLRGDVQ